MFYFLCCFIFEINFKNCYSTSQKLEIDILHRCPSTDRGMRKSWHFCAIEFYSAKKKIEIITFFWNRMKLDILTLSDLIFLSLFFFYHNIPASSTPSPAYRFSITIRCLGHFYSFEALGFSKFVLCLPDLEYWDDLQQLPLTLFLPFENGPWIGNTAVPKDIKRHQQSVLHV